MVPDEIEGGLATLKRIRASKKVVEEFASRPSLRTVTGLMNEQDLDFFKYVMADDELLLIIWEIIPINQKEAIGWAMFVSYDGPPFITFYYFDEAPNTQTSSDCLENMIHIYFKEAEEGEEATEAAEGEEATEAAEGGGLAAEAAEAAEFV